MTFTGNGEGTLPVDPYHPGEAGLTPASPFGT